MQAFLATGHVCAVMGWREYEPIADQYRVPIVVTGCEPLDPLEGVLMAVRQLAQGRCEVENQYVRAVRRSGNTEAQGAVRTVFRVTDRAWRGIGELPGSGLELAGEYPRFDAAGRTKEVLQPWPSPAPSPITRTTSSCSVTVREAG